MTTILPDRCRSLPTRPRNRRNKTRNSIGLVLVGGIEALGTIFTLFIVPSLYVLIARTHNEGAKEKSRGTPEPELSREPELVPEFADA